ncbi:MAG: hypothetical protein LW875_00080 [Proteobacteria bacterium]|jgi:hypothetical protein|nr:hypothetical protein [Pseudomonadota bacterium]
MIIPNDESYFNLVESLKDQLKIKPEIQVRLYSDWSQAAFETVLGVAHFLSHKKSMGIVKGKTFVWNPIMSFLYREAFQVQQVPQAAESFSNDFQTWLEVAKKDTLFVLHQDDHPISGEIYSSEVIDQQLNDRKMFSIRVRHQPSSLADLEVSPNTAVIQLVSGRFALVLLGSKCKFPLLFSSHQSPLVLSQGLVNADLKNFSDDFQDSEKVSAFESSLAANFVAPFARIQRRKSGSLVFGKAGMSGDLLAREISRSIPDLEIQTLSRCYWKAPLSYKDWWDAAPSEDLLNQMVVIPSRALRDRRLQDTLENFKMTPELIV